MTEKAATIERPAPHADCEAEHVGLDHHCEDECALSHCEDGDCDHTDCLSEDDIGTAPGAVSDALQAVWSRLAPEHERNCDWWRSMEEPWSSLREVAGR